MEMGGIVVPGTILVVGGDLTEMVGCVVVVTILVEDIGPMVTVG